MSELNRRHLLTIVGAGLTIAPSAFATSLSQDIAQRLAQARQDGKVAGLHTLLVSQGGRLVFEYYGQGDDEAESRGALGTVVFGPDVPHDLRSVPGTSLHPKISYMSSFRNTPTLPTSLAAIASPSITCSA